MAISRQSVKEKDLRMLLKKGGRTNAKRDFDELLKRALKTSVK